MTVPPIVETPEPVVDHVTPPRTLILNCPFCAEPIALGLTNLDVYQLEDQDGVPVISFDAELTTRHPCRAREVERGTVKIEPRRFGGVYTTPPPTPDFIVTNTTGGSGEDMWRQVRRLVEAGRVSLT